MDSLSEVKSLKTFLSSLFGKPTTKDVKMGTTSVSQVTDQAKQMIEIILKSQDAKIKKVERKKTLDGILLSYHLTVGDHSFIAKCYVNTETRYFNLDLWSKDGQDFLDLLAVGDLKQQYRIRAMGKIRFEPWAKGEKKHYAE